MLIKFLLATQCKSSIQAAEALQIMKRWNNVDHAEAIPMLSGLFCANDQYKTIRVVTNIDN